MIVFRKLTPEDYEDIEEISKDIWEGCDYLPSVFHKWLEDKGIFLGGVDTDNNKVVVVAKLSILYDGSGWLEGLRVHAKYRGQKLAKRATEEILKRATELLENGVINKIAFATHITSIESKTMMEKLNFKLKETQVLAIKNISSLALNINIEDFHVEAWDITFEEFKNHHYIKRRNGLLPLAFVFEEVTFKLYESLKANNSLVKINGHTGLFKHKGEANFIAMEDTFEAINTFMDYYLLKYKNTGIKELSTPLCPQDKALIEKLKSVGYISLADWKPDCLYYIGEK
ncbi:GNAT family N-acetyltransferase [Clostridium sp. FP2]|uniref:GNAT family N-acetyltransferase n=1 Tax=Clostridium TaxID=1485 RepID=UPI0013E90825|nr:MULTISPECIES: GNAT family N-acetyltransferase [Clostridium]MBW9157442.1 GNAT family N-acetyltransferase [Clostridium tagluense]MBZ9622384.1 GNAT family N-acetyltransferase [Clostridium sp. FP2]WLC66692.1 GNAT family N-acetyltransferase [Clostridium tagluense]